MVELGAFVTLEEEAAGDALIVQVVSAPEATVAHGDVPRISDASPLGSRLIGRRAGDRVFVPRKNARDVVYVVRGIRY